MSLKFGVLGCAEILRKFAAAVHEAPNAELVVVGSRSIDKAKEFVATECPEARAVGSYEEVLDDPEVQAVYLPLPTSIRTEWCLKAVAKGKHILTEKPLAPTVEEAEQVVAACAAAGLQYMDHTMFVHNERTDALVKALADEELLGKPKLVSSCFTVPIDDMRNIRVKPDCEPLGCLGDLGWYCIYITMVSFGFDEPESVSCRYEECNAQGVPMMATATLRFGGGRWSRFECSFLHAIREWVEVVSDKSTLRLEDFIVTDKLECSFEVSRRDRGDRVTATLPKTVLHKADIVPKLSQHARLVETFSAMVLAGGEVNATWPKKSLLVHRTLCACARSAGEDGAWKKL